MKQLKCLKKYVLSLLLLLVFVMIATARIQASESKDYIIDDAGLLTESEQDELNSYSKKCSEDRGSDILVLTTDDTQGLGSELYLENFYDNEVDGSSTYNESCAILLIDMENRQVKIYSFGDIKPRLDNPRIEKILDKVTPSLTSGDYNDAINSYIEKTDLYMGTKAGVDPDNIFFQLWFQLLIAAVIGFVVVLIMILGAGGKVTTNSHTYLNDSESALTGARDDYIRTTVTKVKKPENNSNKGSGTTSGGNSFNSGGRGF